MSWANDIRCLYCDGKLPLYRKLTSGQFCSTAHCNAYWQQQEGLALERLRQTHDRLRQAHDPLHPPPGAVAAAQQIDPVPGFGGLIRLELKAVVHMPACILGEAFAVEITSLMLSPSWRPQGRAPRGLSMAILKPLDISTVAVCVERRWIRSEPRPLEYIAVPAGTIRPLLTIERRLTFAGPIALAFAGRILTASPKFSTMGEVTPLVSSVKPLYPAYTAAALNDALQVLLPTDWRDEQVPVADKLLLLSCPTVRPGIHPIAPGFEQTMPDIIGLAPQFPSYRRDAGVPHADALLPLPHPALREGTQLIAQDFEETIPDLISLAPQFPPYRCDAEAHITCPEKLLLLPLPGVREGTNRIAENSWQTTPIFTNLPPQFPPDSAGPDGLPRIVPTQAGLSRLSIDRIPLVQGAWIDNLRAVELGGVEQAGQLVTPSRLPSLRLAKPSRCTAETRENKAATLAEVEPTGFSSAAPRISLPLIGAPLAPTPMPVPPAGRLLPVTPAVNRGKAGIGSIPAPRLSLPVPQSPSRGPLFPGLKLEPLEFLSSKAIPGTAEIFRQSHYWAYTAAIPMLLGLALYVWTPKASGGIPRAFESAVHTQFQNVKRSVLERAAVALNEDFRAGLDNWTSRDGAATDWSFDATGFVRPGPLALYRPSLGLSDYQMQFLGLIDKKALSWVVRAADFRNYYVVKLVVRKAGPLPTLGITRYAVVNGRADSRVETIAAVDARPDTLYRVRMDVRGDAFLLTIQGQIVDNWSEPRLKHGGVGLFSGAGEASRVRWVQVKHQYDVLGRLCAYLAPYDFQLKDGSLK